MTPLIIGDRRDSHVVAVLDAMATAGCDSTVVVDAPRLQEEGFSLDLDRLRQGELHISLRAGSRGWLRRYAPTGWGTGVVAGSLEAVTKRAFLALVGALTRLGDRDWLTPLDAMLAAEDRLSQLDTARALGLRIPDTLVTSDASEAAARLGEPFVVKPLTGGYFWKQEAAQAVFASTLALDEALGVDFKAAPFVAQARLDAREHLRVVTVQDEAWVASLSADGRPLDWRQQEEAHFSWRPTNDDDACDCALQLAKALGVGYTSQDWIRDDHGLAFLDLNPGGQWLFLPDEVASPVTRSVARFLIGMER